MRRSGKQESEREGGRERREGSQTLQDEISELELGVREVAITREATIEVARRVARYLGQNDSQLESFLSMVKEEGRIRGGNQKERTDDHIKYAAQQSGGSTYPVVSARYTMP